MKEKMETGTDLFRTEKIPKILLKIAPPVMLAQLIQAMYNIVDSYFVAQVSESAMTALNRPIRLKRLSWQSDTR